METVSPDWSFLDDRMVQRAVEKYAHLAASKMGGEDVAFSTAVCYIAHHPEMLSGRLSARIVRRRLTEALDREERRSEKLTEPKEAMPEPDVISPPIPTVADDITPGTYGFVKVVSLAWCIVGFDDIESMHDPLGLKVEAEVKTHVYTDPSHANDLWAEVADVRSALSIDTDTGLITNRAGLTLDELDSVRCIYIDYDEVNGSRQDADRGIIKIVNYLNS